MMAQAFYPTNDGHVGNLQKLTDIQLQDLIKRQENLLKKKSFINKLPDKGNRIKEHLDSLLEEGERRERERNSQSVPHDGDACERLVADLEHLDMTTDDDQHSRQTTQHYFDIAVHRAEQNSKAGIKQPLKLNRNLKIDKVHELPKHFLKEKKAYDMKQKHVSLQTEESAAVPPVYKYQAQQIHLQESLQLQQQQKQKQEELHATVAAQKLVQRLNIKMDTYNPEGLDMSYRSNIDRDLDSDDDDQETEGVNHMTLDSSDSEGETT